MATSRDYLQLHFIVILWGFTAILGKLISVPTLEMIWYRSALSVIGMGLVVYLTRGTFRVSGPDALRLLGIGAIVAIHWMAFFGAARIANVSVGLVGFATNSLWAALLEPWSRKEKVKKYELALGLVVLTGLYIIFSFDFQYKLGLAVGVFAGFTAALFAVFNARMVSRVPARTITFYEMIGIVLFSTFCFPFAEGMGVDIGFDGLPSTMDFIYIAILAGACSVYAYTVAVELMKRISVFVIQLSLNLEPIYGIVMAVLIFGEQEKMNWNFYLGAIVILSAVLSYPLIKRRFDRTVLID